jgi:hypothetical protein
MGLSYKRYLISNFLDLIFGENLVLARVHQYTEVCWALNMVTIVTYASENFPVADIKHLIQ